MPKTAISRTAIIRCSVGARRKLRVDHIFRELGPTTRSAISLFYAQVDQHRGLPFDDCNNP